MSDRKKLSRAKRKTVYGKYGGRCAYCGCQIIYKDMQIDHIEPIYKYETAYQTGNADWLDDVKNLLPSCRMCNFYKSTMTIEQFRDRLQTVHDRLEKTFIYRLAKKYGLIVEKHEKITFLFERDGE